MDNVLKLQKELQASAEFITNILAEMKEIYELFDGLKKHAEIIEIEFKLLITEIEKQP